MEQARGKVFEMVLAPADEERFAGQFEIVSRGRDGAASRVRAVAADGRLPEGAVPVETPTLEEGYLAFIASDIRSAAQ